MILLSFDAWNSKHGYFLSWRRIYRNGKWTPFCRVGKRYDSWLGHWKELDPTIYELTFTDAMGNLCIGSGPDWKISVPDGHAGTASIMYKGQPLNVISADLHLQAGEAALLTLEVWGRDVEAAMGILDVEIEVVPCE